MRIYTEFAPQGDMIALKKTGLRAVGGGLRGDIKYFSRQSRSRLMRRMAQVQRGYMPLFVTLTYPEDYPGNFEEYKSHLHSFLMSMKYHFPDYGAIWRLEYQKRGAPHYHIFLYGVSKTDAMDKIPYLWFLVAGGGDEKHLLFHQGLLKDKDGNTNNHCVEGIRSWNGVRCYAAKYLAKLGEDGQPSGRYWGCVGKVPMSKIIQMKIDLETALEFRRAFRRSTGYKSKRFGFWAYGYHVDWLKFIDEVQTKNEQAKIPEEFPPGWWRDIPRNEQNFFIA